MTPTQFLQENNIDTKYVKSYNVVSKEFLHIPLEQLLSEYANSIELLKIDYAKATLETVLLYIVPNNCRTMINQALKELNNK